jgi:hypothetical protein
MIVLYEYAVIEPVTVVPSSPHAHRLLIKKPEPRRGLSGICYIYL